MSNWSRNTRWPRRIAAVASLTLLFALPTTVHPDAVPTVGAWVSPTTGRGDPGVVLRPFDPPAHDWLPGHRGVDLALPRGGPVRAAGDGTVFFSGAVAGTATVSIDHPDGTRTTYQPVIATVTAGDTVTEGQVIGTLGTDPRGWPGLSWGARRDGAYVNPLGLLPRPLIRLKPVDGPA
ncbi:M23 family metallopeptidase [Corynebacterium sp. CCM 9185]|uniref:M23 family metallopeptidase n=1 Tax=Corynebacterium marambiense TaxID=2765364 RepID=A0ABS0VVC7_9CORY|nr:M23 family metallopeptidase [Corynebacterium marambiense]MBI9000749.1 M23 family metallopeptidase [Corynebacterium marambiense]MCK7662988.1 M23 family metallopeptidase [Corynebacterium marambiense]MCX7542602.1 M23 family metallopeptidase [Corynebacterium marambiense]